MANEPSFVDGGDAPAGRPIYYHYGLDIGGCEGLVEVVAATDGLVVSAGGKAPARVSRHPVLQARRLRRRLPPRRPGLVLPLQPPADDRPGDPPRGAGQDGPEDRRARQGGLERRLVAPALRHQGRQPSGKWGIQEGYAFLWEAYRREHKPQIIAVARPHHLIWAGEKVVLDGSRSWSADGQDRALRVDLHRRDRRDRIARGTHVRQAGGIQRGPEGRRRPGPGGLRLRRGAGHRQGARRQVLADDPRELRADLRHPPGGPGHVQGADVLRASPRARRGTSATAARP